MAGFHTHITVSTLVGVGYAAVGGSVFELPLATCAIGGGLCAISGIMPDLDSDHAVPARETLSFLAAIAPMLLFYRMHYEGLATENILLFGAPLYLLIRFGFGQMLKVSVHRGMFHSIPAAVIAGLIAYVLCDTGVGTGRIYKACGATIGYLTHLILDEIWAVEMIGGPDPIEKIIRHRDEVIRPVRTGEFVDLGIADGHVVVLGQRSRTSGNRRAVRESTTGFVATTGDPPSDHDRSIATSIRQSAATNHVAQEPQDDPGHSQFDEDRWR